jgi:VanZ family protein
MRAFLKYWLVVLLWMALVFSASADSHSYQHSSRILGPLLHWLFPHLSESTLDLLLLLGRKCAHLTEYAVLGALIWRALRRPARNDPRPWSWRPVLWSVLCVALYASSDEFHQRFVPSRDPEVRDVAIDTMGGILGILAVSGATNWLTRRRRGRAPQAVPDLRIPPAA